MLTIKQITENTDEVIRGLEKKHFKDAKQVIAQVVELNNKRRRGEFAFQNDWFSDERG